MRSVGKNGYRSENIWNRLIFKTESIDVKKDSCMKTYKDSFFMSGNGQNTGLYIILVDHLPRINKKLEMQVEI